MPHRASRSAVQIMAIVEANERRSFHLSASPSQEATDEFDVVLIGAGPSAIGLLYGILTKPSLKSLRIAVIELGENHPKTPQNEASVNSSNRNHARYWFQQSHAPKSPFDAPTRKLYPTTPQIHLNNRILDVPIGIGIGGGSNINACFCSEPDFIVDFKDWPGVWKNGDLIRASVEEVLRIMKKNGGITKWAVCPKYGKLFHLRERDAGDGTVDFPSCSGFKFLPSFYVATDPKGNRINYYDSILSPLLYADKSARDRIKFFTGMAANRIIIENQKATGVECVRVSKGGAAKSPPFVIKVLGEVILCAGTIMSPALLIMSGIGDQKEVSEAGVSECHAHVPAVGKNLRDHILLPRAFLTPSQRHIRKSVNCCQAKYMLSVPAVKEGHDEDSVNSPLERTVRDDRFELMLTDGAISWMILPHVIASIFRRGTTTQPLNNDSPMERSTMLTALAHISGNFLNMFCWVVFSVANILIFILLSYTPARFVIRHFTAVVNISLLNPQSTGDVKVRLRKKPADGLQATLDDVEILVNPGYLTNQRDINALRSGWKASDDIVKRHFRSCIEILPGILGQWKWYREEWLSFYAKEFVLSYYHWIGTCVMGDSEDDDKEYVVNERLQVTEMKNIRVCDASVFPDCISAPTALTCAGIGFAASDFLVESRL